MVVLLDADAMLEEDWLEKIIPSFDNPTVAAVGRYAVMANSSIIGKIAGCDVESCLMLLGYYLSREWPTIL